MPPRTSAPAREYDYSNVGKVGRRTGITLQPRKRDEHGLEEMTGLFSSPEKASPAARKSILQSIEITPRALSQTPTRPRTPAAAASLRKSRGSSHPVPRFASPRKSGISGTARRNGAIDVLAQHQLQQETNQAIEAVTQDDQQTQDDTQLSITPIRSVNAKAASARPATVRRFSPSHTPLRSRVLRPKSAYVGRTSDVTSVTPRNDEEDLRDETSSHVQINHDPSESTLADNQAEIIDDVDAIDDGVQEQLDTTEHAYIETEPPLPPVIDDEDLDETFEPEKRTSTRRPPSNVANSRKKRKSDALDEAEIEGAAISSPAAKRAKRKSDQIAKSKPKAVPSQKSNKLKSTKERPALKEKTVNSTLSQRQQKELDDVIEQIKARPGPARSLYVLRKETPADDHVTHTRSGRISIKPLAYWRNEGIVYDVGDGTRGLADGAKFPLNSIKEIIRTEESIESTKRRPKGTKSRKGKSKHQAVDEDPEADMDAEDPDADDWEIASGTLRAPVAVWDQLNQGPLGDEEDLDIAHAAAAIQTRDVGGSTFKYSKLVSSKFFGTGVVDLPPGGVKKVKNSRKMHMCFFVFQGRVTVEIGPLHGDYTRFSIGKGGFWQVPRGNNYSIENEHGKLARLFFSQACEPAPPGFEED